MLDGRVTARSFAGLPGINCNSSLRVDSHRLTVMTRQVRISILIGFISGLFCWVGSRGRPEIPGWANRAGDFGWAILAAQDLWNGRDPYDHPFGREVVPYPIPAALLVLPVSWLRHDLAGALFFGLSSALLSAGLLRNGNGALWVFLSYPYFAALPNTQWAPLVMAAAFHPFLFPMTLAKPNIGLPVLLTRWSKTGLFAALALLLGSLLVYPQWPLRWLSQVGGYQSFVPLLTFPGFLLLVALCRWRSDSARFLLLASVVPQRWFYDSLILWLIPKKGWQYLMTAAFSWLSFVGWMLFPRTIENVGLSVVLFAYLPMLVVESVNGPPLTQSFSELRDRFIGILSRSKFQE